MTQYLEDYRPHVDLNHINETLAKSSGWNSSKNKNKYQHIYQKLKSINLNEISPLTKEYSGASFNTEDSKIIEQLALDLIPWRKGPFKIGNLEIDAEWRSDQKWKRINEFLPKLENQTILDIGCNNGYYMFQMLKYKPKLVLGIDPVLHCKAQFDFINHFVQAKNLKMELLGVEDVKSFLSMFDVVFSMGILYHHRHPLEQLIDIREALKSGGTAIIETIGIPGEESICLFPEDKYSKMRNVWFLPTESCFKNWLHRTGFTDIELISSSTTDFSEQRLSRFCPPPHQSLEDFLNPEDHSKTVEGYPAPMRFCYKAKKKQSPIKKFPC